MKEMLSSMTTLRHLVLLTLLFVLSAVHAQGPRSLITIHPQYPTLDEPVDIIYDASQGNGELSYYSNDVYAYTGITTNQGNWQYEVANWDATIKTSKLKMTRLGDNKWRLRLDEGIKSFYNIQDGEEVHALNFIFRGSNNDKNGRLADNGDANTDIIISIRRPQPIISTIPETAVDDGWPLRIIFDAAQGTGGLKDYNGDAMYAYTGHQPANKWISDWNNPDEKFKMTPLGNNKWELLLPDGISSFYGSDDIEKLLFVFHSTDTKQEGKDVGGDIELGVSPLLVRTNPQIITETSQPVIITFNLALGNGQLNNHDDDVYVHTGVITTSSTSTDDWKYASSWGKNDERYKVVKNGNQCTFTIDNLREFYGITSETERIRQLAFVLRSADGSKVGKTKLEQNIFVNVYQPGGIASRIDYPQEDVIKKGQSIPISASALTSTNLKLFINDAEIEQVANAKIITKDYTFNAEGAYRIKVTDENGITLAEKEVRVIARDTQQTASLPAGLVPGINYSANDNTKATLVLQAPYKTTAWVVGDFNNWQYHPDYVMSYDGEYFWVDLNNLIPGEEYAYQYVIDGSIYVADPYTDKVLDPWNDSYISNETYPNLKPYPTNAKGIVSVLQTGQTPYDWKATKFVRPQRDNLIIYEMHLRDFTSSGDYKGALEKLNYLETLGVNAIELMPINEFEGNDSWGYNPSFYFAVDKAYGSKNDLKLFIDECHARGIAVIIDMVLNHSFGQSPLLHLYQNELGKPTILNPWYNQEHNFANKDAQWGVDFNHESEYTRTFVDRVNKYWIEEFKIDGIRYDFTKGFTNTHFPDGWGSAEDAGRVFNLRRMVSQIREYDPSLYVIFEHLTPENGAEERVLTNNGIEPYANRGLNIMLWRKVDKPYWQTAMGYSTESAFNNLYDWDSNVTMPTNSLVGYIESHDEERCTVKAKEYGIDAIKNSNSNRMKQAAVNAAFFLTVPGPKMMWQFGELGYDYSIDENGRTGRKPIRWDYYEDADRKMLYDTYSKLLNLRKNYPSLFSYRYNSNNNKGFRWHVDVGDWDNGRLIICEDEERQLVIVGNFDSQERGCNIYFPSGGIWYNYMNGTTTDVTSNFTPEGGSGYKGTITLPPHQFALYTNFDTGTPQVYTSDLDIPGKYTTTTEVVLKAGNWTAENLDKLNSTTFPKVETADLSGIELPENTNLGNGLFAGCATLTNLHLPQSNYTGSTLLAEGANSNCFTYIAEGSTVPADWTNIVCNGKAVSHIVIDDAQPFHFAQNFEVDDYTVNYTRTFTGATKDKGWEAISLPFNVTTITESTRGDIVPVTNTQEGNFWLSKYMGSSEEGIVNFGSASEIEAYTPYIIAFPGTAWGTKYQDEWEVTFTGGKALFDSGIEAKTTGNNYHYVGTLANITDDSTNPKCYILNSELNKFEKVAEQTLKPFRGYFVDATSAQGAPTRSSLSIGNGNGEITSIEQFEQKQFNIYSIKGYIVIETTQAQPVSIFNQSGVQVYKSLVPEGETKIQLPQGFYIVNNQKVIVY